MKKGDIISKITNDVERLTDNLTEIIPELVYNFSLIIGVIVSVIIQEILVKNIKRFSWLGCEWCLLSLFAACFGCLEWLHLMRAERIIITLTGYAAMADNKKIRQTVEKLDLGAVEVKIEIWFWISCIYYSPYA